MIPNIGWGETMVLLVAALVILGPERLPGAIKWTFDALRRVREFASGASSQLRKEIGPEFDDLRKPLADLQRMRGMSPRSVITKHLLDGDDSLFTDLDQPHRGEYKPTPDGLSTPLPNGERPPIDLDAT
ncbi:MAG: Sec-independent protein translocase subunit TatB [Mycobacteriaceae bacterium]|nr:Sec-independent protein translocase subunit TatB [Mycobacteriaceae bacterium]